MDHNDIPDVFWEALNDLDFDDFPPSKEPEQHLALPEGLTDVLEVAGADLSFGRMVHLVGDPASTSVAYTHVVLQRGLLGIRVYFPARSVPGGVGIPAYLIGFRDMPQVRRMYEVRRVLSKLRNVSDARSAYGQAVSSATVRQAVRALAGLSRYETLPFTLYPLTAA